MIGATPLHVPGCAVKICPSMRVPLSEGGDRIDHLLTHVEIFCEDGGYRRENLLRAGLQMREYVVSAAISMAAVGLSPGAQIVDS